MAASDLRAITQTHFIITHSLKERRRISIAEARNQSLLYMEMRVGVESVARARENPQALMDN